MLSFGAFSHMKTEAISQMLSENGKIDLNIKPRNVEVLELTIIPRQRAKFLESLEKEMLQNQKALAWENENVNAIAEQHDRIQKRGLFSDSSRRF